MAGKVWKVLWIALVAVTCARWAQSAALGSAVRRDTDEAANLRAKLHKLHALLSDLYADDDTEEESTSNPEAKLDAKVKDGKVTDDGADDSKELDALKEKVSVPAHESEQGESSSSNLTVEDEESIQVLARALTRLRKPDYDRSNSAGEYLSTEYNEVPITADTRQMEDVVQRALERLSQEKGDRYPPRGQREKRPQQMYDEFDEGEFGDFPETESQGKLPPLSPAGRVGTYHEDALKAVELRLMRDLDLARKLGVSVDELIDDLDDKAYREAELREIERKLAGLDRQPYKE